MQVLYPFLSSAVCCQSGVVNTFQNMTAGKSLQHGSCMRLHLLSDWEKGLCALRCVAPLFCIAPSSMQRTLGMCGGAVVLDTSRPVSQEPALLTNCELFSECLGWRHVMISTQSSVDFIHLIFSLGLSTRLQRLPLFMWWEGSGQWEGSEQSNGGALCHHVGMVA